jgi:glycosyltransferase involved in cell wall biosynthesis
MNGADFVITGNRYLESRARSSGNSSVDVIPTVLDPDRYQVKEHIDTKVPAICWIGSPGSVRYLSELIPLLERLSKEFSFKLRIIGASIHQPVSFEVEFVEWKEETEANEISRCDIGIMPLSDSPWARGKCGYKLIQYMASGLPVVASPVGANRQIIREGETGYFAETEKQWLDALIKLGSSIKLRQAFGRRGRQIVEHEYSISVTAPKIADIFQSITHNQ